jgi:AcrR family transcriptional regulator
MAADSDAPAGLAAVHELLWGQRPPPRRGPRPALSVTEIARAGVAVADGDGIGAVTMQRVADELGVTKMALYRYVPGKAELIALMTDIGLGAPPRLADVPGGWRPRLQAWARQLYEQFRQHPWALQVTTGVRAMGPNELGWLEEAVAALSGTGLDGGQALDVAVTLIGHARTIAEQGAATAGDSPERTMDEAIATLLRDREDRFPALAAALSSAAEHNSQDHALDLGFNLILDGAELLIAQGGQHTRRAGRP